MHLRRVFEALCTTKPNGTGVGLSTCRSIIDADGDQLSADANEAGDLLFKFTSSSAENERAAPLQWFHRT
jgi:signal transduction histidine kinase